MLKNTVLDQKIERDRLLGLDYVPREKLASASQLLENNLIKVVIGPRRCGKSVFVFELLKKHRFAYLNFEDDNLLKTGNYDEFLSALLEVYGKTDYLFFDEIQNLPRWEMWVNKLHRRGYNLVITGSNANLLSQELATSLTGRHATIALFPFSFREFIKTGPDEILLRQMSQYLTTGGFPEVVTKNLDPQSYLKTLLDAVIFKDIVKRYRIKMPVQISQLVNYFLANISSTYSLTKLKNSLGFNSVLTVQNYLSYLEEAFLITSLNRFSFKLKEQFKAPRKIYTVDNGFVNVTFSNSPNTGKLMENLVFNALVQQELKPNFDLFYYQTKTRKEIDFICKNRFLIQVCLNLEHKETSNREISALIEGSNELGIDDLKIITWEEEKEIVQKNKIIHIIPLWKFLLN